MAETVEYALNLDFSESFPDELAHNRASGATYVDASGNVVWADENLVTATTTFGSGWTTAGIDLTGDEASVDLGGSNANYATYDDTNNAFITAGTLLPAEARTEDWTRVELEVDIPSTCTLLRLYFLRAGSSPSLYISMAVKAGSKVTMSAEWRLVDGKSQIRYPMAYTGGADGRVYLENTTSSARYTPRITHDADGNVLGYLHETQGTNTIVSSSDYTDAAWVKQGLIVDEGSVIAPDGNSVPVFKQDTSTGSHRMFDGAANTIGEVHTVSLYLKYLGSARYARVESRINTSVSYIRIDLLSMIITSETGDISGSKLEECANGWYRYSFQTTASNATGLILVNHYDVTGTTLNFTGDGVANYGLWGIQVELGGAATSLIPTYGAEATRQADFAELGEDNFDLVWNENEGTLIFEGYVFKSDTNNLRILSDGANRRWAYANFPGDGGITEDLVAYDGATTPTLADDVRLTDAFSFAIAVELTELRCSFNGGAVVTVSHNGNLIDSVTNLKILENHSGVITSIKYADESFTDEMLAAPPLAATLVFPLYKGDLEVGIILGLYLNGDQIYLNGKKIYANF